MENDVILRDPSSYSLKGKVAIVHTMWHHALMERMLIDALEVLSTQSDLETLTYEVAGTVELANTAYNLLQNPEIDGIILMGAVVRGGTPHFDYVCDIISQAVATLNTRYKAPTIFGVLTVNSVDEAEERVHGKNNHTPKGRLDALALLQQLSLSYD